MIDIKLFPLALPALVEQIAKGYDNNQNPLHQIRKDFCIDTHFEYLQDYHYSIAGDSAAFAQYGLKDQLCVFLKQKKFPKNHLNWEDMTEKDQEDFLQSEQDVEDTPYEVLICYNQYWANTEGKSNLPPIELMTIETVNNVIRQAIYKKNNFSCKTDAEIASIQIEYKCQKWLSTIFNIESFCAIRLMKLDYEIDSCCYDNGVLKIFEIKYFNTPFINKGKQVKKIKKMAKIYDFLGIKYVCIMVRNKNFHNPLEYKEVIVNGITKVYLNSKSFDA